MARSASKTRVIPAMSVDERRYRRWRLTVTVIGGLLLACEAIMVMGYVGAVISERTTGSWALLGTAIAAGIFHLPLALLGVLFGVVLLVEPGGGRVSIGLPLFGFSLAMLFVDNVFVRFGTAIADWLGY